MSLNVCDTGKLLDDRLSELVTKHLGVPDKDFMLSKFVTSLYGQSGTRNNSDRKSRLNGFIDVLKNNGAGEFPPKFIDEAFLLIDEYEYHLPIKEEPKDDMLSDKQATDSKVFKSLNIPDKPVRWTEEDFVNEYKHISKEEEKSTKVEVKQESNNIKHEKRYTVKEEPIEAGNVYKGYVSNITTYGAFIRLNNLRSFQSGLCHVSQISFDGRTRIQNPSDVLKLNQEIFVKVLNIETQTSQIGRRTPREKISLSMRGIDQTTGLDRNEEINKNATEEREGRIRKTDDQSKHSNRGVKRRLTSPERWEIRQLIASGAMSAKDYPELLQDEDPNAAFRDDTANVDNNDNDLEIDIELNHEEPAFLKGQTQNSVDLAPVKIIKNPEGSLSRVAMNGSKLARDIKEERLKENREKEKRARQEKAKSKDSHDPLNRENNAQYTEIVNTNEKTQNFISEWKKSQMDKNISYGKRTKLSMKEQRESLPIFPMRSNLINAVRENPFLVIVGETGSGKTTQIVQYLAEEGLDKVEGEQKIIGCTQPRRVAAVSVAKRVAEEYGCKVGEDVGYTIRFEDKTSRNTRMKYMTDGMLQREALNDPLMSKYSVIMLDEAHERTIATDVLFTLLKKAVANNPNLKIIVTSATLDANKFSNYFNSCPIIKIPGRTYPVDILYTREPEMDYLSSALDSVIQIHISEPEGDILVFLTGQEEIDTSCEVLFERMKVLGDTVPELIILPVYSALPSEMQSKIFEPTPPGSRKVILATNIAETSITIDGIYYVVDPGFVKINAYDSKLGMDSLTISPISQAQANQRSGRAGRTGPGKCYRLYTESAFKTEMLPNTIPEIQRQNLSHTILMLKAMGINDLLNFEFMDPPPTNTMLNALQDLYTLSALDDDGYLTKLGRKMAEFPMEPALAKTLIISVDFGCSDEILTIVAMLSVQTVFFRPKEKQKEADQKKYRFHHQYGDHLTLLNVYRSWTLNGCNKQWCMENYIQDRSMKRAQEVRKQLVLIMSKYRHPIISCGSNLDKVRKTLCAGFFKHSSKRDPQEGYKTLVEQTPVHLHPSSALFGKSPDYVIYHTLLLTSKEYMHCVTVIDAKWLLELAPAFFKKTDPAKLSEKRKNDKIVPLFDKFLKDKDSWRLSSQASIKKRALGNS